MIVIVILILVVARKCSIFADVANGGGIHEEERSSLSSLYLNITVSDRFKVMIKSNIGHLSQDYSILHCVTVSTAN